MWRDLRGAVVAIVLATLVFGFAYPAVMTGFAQVTFQNKANGSLVDAKGRLVGSKLAAQGFTWPKYFHERPSGTSPAYNAGATTFLNLGPTNPDLAKLVAQNAQAIATIRIRSVALPLRSLPSARPRSESLPSVARIAFCSSQ